MTLIVQNFPLTSFSFALELIVFGFISVGSKQPFINRICSNKMNKIFLATFKLTGQFVMVISCDCWEPKFIPSVLLHRSPWTWQSQPTGCWLEYWADGRPVLLVTLPLQTVLKIPVIELFRLLERVNMLLMTEPCTQVWSWYLDILATA